MSGTHGVFQHRSGYFYTILEEDFCEVFKAPGVNEVCRAYITSILEHLTNKQFEATGKETDLWVFMSLPEMARRMRHACSERTIHKELQGMIKDGYIEKRRAVGKATMEYKLNLKRIRKALEALPDNQSCNSATYHLANLQEPSSNSARSTLQNDKINLANLQPRITIDIPIEETKNNNEGSVNSASAEVDAPANIIPQNRLQERITDKHKAINLKGQAAHGNSSDDLPRSGNDSNGDNVQPGTSGEAGGQMGRGNMQHDSGRQAEAESQLEQTISTKVIGQTPVQRSGVSPSTGTLARPDAAQGGMAMTTRQIRAQNEKREKELWAIIEAELHTTFTVNQRKLHKDGMNLLIADDISDEAIRAGLQALDAFQRKSFTVYKFYGWLPNLSAKTPTPITSKAPAQNNYVNHDLNMKKLEERKARLAANG